MNSINSKTSNPICGLTVSEDPKSGLVEIYSCTTSKTMTLSAEEVAFLIFILSNKPKITPGANDVVELPDPVGESITDTINPYTTDVYPREGLSLLITLGKSSWSCATYMPGCEPVGGVGCVESRIGKTYASLGVFITDFIIAGEDLRSVKRKMILADQRGNEALTT